MEKCFALKYGECMALNYTKCEGCAFYKTKTQLKEELQRSKQRIKQLSKEDQMYIAEKYASK